MYVKNSRKLNILEKMVDYFSDLEQYEKCAHLMKGIRVLNGETTNETV